MNTYETLVILKPIVDVDNSDTALKAVENTIETLKGKILKQEKMGRKRLAYEINKFKDGFLTNMVVQMDPGAVEPFRRACALNEDILRVMITTREGWQPGQETVMTPPRPRHFERGGERPDFRGGDRPGFRGGERPGFRGGDRPDFRNAEQRPDFRGGNRPDFRNAEQRPELQN